MRVGPIWILLTLAPLLVACGSVPIDKLHYYRLLPPATGVAEAAGTDETASGERELVVVADVSVAEVLDQGSLLMQLSDQEVAMASYHKWASPLPNAIALALQQSLSQQDIKRRYELAAGRWTAEANYYIRLRVNEFYPNAQGEVLNSGEFWIYDRDQRLLSSHNFALYQANNGVGYGAAAEALARSLGQLASLISQELAAMTTAAEQSE